MTPDTLQSELIVEPLAPNGTPETESVDDWVATLGEPGTSLDDRNEAFGSLVKKFSPELNRRAYRLTGDSELTKDIVQDALLKAYEKIPSYRPIGSFGGWLMRITSNRALDMHKRAEKRLTKVTPEVHADEPKHFSIYGENSSYFEQDPASIYEEKYERQNRLAVLNEAMRHLTSAQQEVLDLHFQGLASEEIAQKLGLKPAAVRALMHRAKKVLSAQLINREAS